MLKNATFQNKSFKCEICNNFTCYSFFGKQNQASPSIIFFNDVYFLRNPFSPSCNTPIIMGGNCSECTKAVCASPGCSIYYKSLYCANCLHLNTLHLPEELIQLFRKRSKQNLIL